MSLLSVRNLDVFYGPLQAVRGLSLQVAEGQLVTLLGANGAGKSSTIRAICGLLASVHTAIELDGRPIGKLRSDQRVALGIATVPEGRELFRSLTIEENLMMGAYRRRGRDEIRRDLDWVYSRFPMLTERRRA